MIVDYLARLQRPAGERCCSRREREGMLDGVYYAVVCSLFTSCTVIVLVCAEIQDSIRLG